ncbi:Z-DNA-binding protein 1 isoform X3 [Vulpes vulpes]|uniref:Z-DNA-binding protein 1 isoform X3 n=1 Tax=Vulpes vulpes TaxID=9627 RepID=A0ABM4YMX2_VULVU
MLGRLGHLLWSPRSFLTSPCVPPWTAVLLASARVSAPPSGLDPSCGDTSLPPSPRPGLNPGENQSPLRHSLLHSDLEQRILQALRDTGSPIKSIQLAKELHVPKKKLNQVLYRLMKESKVSQEGQATWALGTGRTGRVVPAEPAQANQAERCQQDIVAVPEEPGLQLTGQQEAIYRFLEAHGPCKALNIAKGVGKKTAKDVNRDLYDMRKQHKLDFDEKTSTWAIYQPDLGGGNRATAIIYQKNPINMICQNGPHNHISIDNSENIQIGQGNVMVRQVASGDNGSMAPLPPVMPADPSTQGSPAAAWGPQDIHLEKTMLRRVQMGHDNMMNLNSAPTKGPAACSPFGSSSGPSSEGDVAQRVHISSCILEDTAIGNSNRMTVSSGTDGPGGVARPEDAGEPGKDAGAESRSHVTHDRDQASPGNGNIFTEFISHLEAVTLESRGPQAAEAGSRVDRTADEDPQGQGESRTSSQALSGGEDEHQ